MSLTGKTIGELVLLSGITPNTLFAVELSGVTYHIPYSGMSSNNFVETTYDELYNSITGDTLTPGTFYLMTDFQTCYDQPNYNNVKDPITTGNYKTGTTEPILLLSISTTGFSPTVYSTLYPQDKITYDITWDTTEVTSGATKGRITERIDNFNNRTDYDHRTILFKRYNGYSYNESNPLSGLVGISGITGTTAVLYGNTGTTFNSTFSIGSLVAVTNITPSIFEVVSVQSNSLAIISGVSISNTSNSPYYSVIQDGIINYYQPNIRQNEVFEYTTFGEPIEENVAINNYVGNYSNLYVYEEYPFLLANNVFLDGSFINNTIGNNSYNNTFNDDCDSNQIGDSFYNNSTNNDFDGNIIGDYFNNNYITSNFNNNRIGSDFDNNILLGGSFYRNNIGNDFTNNVWTNNDFQNNEIGNQFNDNKIYNNFYNNDIGNGYNGNKSYSDFYRNLIGNGYNNNTIYSEFYENNIGHVFGNNVLGDSLNYGSVIFTQNIIGNRFENNDCLGNFIQNRLGNYFENNNCLGDFSFNFIGNEFTGNNIQDGFGFGYNTSQGNVIGNYFYNNTIGEYFYNNTIADGFYNNQVFDFFQMNNIKFNLFDNDFTQYYGNITAFTYASNGSTATDDTYSNLSGFTNGVGIGAIFSVMVVSGVVDSVNLTSIGKYYSVNNTITILGSQIGGTDGDDDIVITVTGVTPVPSVYEAYNCDIFKNAGNINRLSFYDASDILTIKNINE